MDKIWKVSKSSLADWNKGICGSKNNSRYSGQSVVWVIVAPDGFEVCAIKTKRDAQFMIDLFNADRSLDKSAIDLPIETAIRASKDKPGMFENHDRLFDVKEL